MGRSVGRSRAQKSKSKNKKNNKINKNNQKTTTKRNATKASSKKTTKPKIVKLKIFNINDHCLIKIFEYLSIEDLVNLSIVIPRFKSSTSIVFKQNFAKHVININNAIMPTMDQLPSVLLLQSFGHLIKKLKVNYKDDYNRFNGVFEKAIIKYCNKSVTEIELMNADKFAFTQIKRPLMVVSKVVFTKCVVGRFFFEIGKWFPNAQSLQILESTILSASDVKCIEQNYPKLEHLAIINPQQRDEGYNDVDLDSLLYQPKFANVNLKATIDLNPQLRSLKLKHNNNDFVTTHHNYADRCGIEITPTLLAYMNEKLPLLDELDLFVSHIDNEEYIEHQQVHFRNLRKIRFVVDYATTLKHYQISTRHPAKIILTANQNLNFYCAIFLSKNEMWRKIVLNGDWESYQCYETVKIRLSKLPSLNSVKISVNGLKGQQKGVVQLLNECQFLKKLKVRFSIIPWYKLTQVVDYDLDADDKRREELKLLDSLKLLRNRQTFPVDFDEDDADYWMQNFSDIETDSEDSDGELASQRVRNALPAMLEKLGNSTLESYRKSVKDKRFNMWQSTYHKQEHFFCATFVPKDNRKMSV